jgi:enediyne biosynthesis protein E4
MNRDDRHPATGDDYTDAQFFSMNSRHRRVLAIATATVLAVVILSIVNRLSHGPPAVQRSQSATPWFEEVASRNGLQFIYESGHDERHYFPEIMGGGAALLDIDGDDDLDIFFVQGGSVTDGAGSSHSRLFRNRGNGVFDDVSVGSGAEVAGYGMGATVADYDNDGDADLYVTRLGANVLLRNDGQGRFTDVTARAGVADAGWSTSAAFLDVDRDGHLDLFVAHYVNWSLNTELNCHSVTGARDYCSPLAYHSPAAATLFRNAGDGTFKDVSATSGVGEATGNGLGVTVGDVDGDGSLDIFVANDGTPNHPITCG